MTTLVQTFEDFPLTFLEHQTIPYISHKSLSDYFKWPKTTRKNKFQKIAENHPEMVAYFKTTHGGGAQKMGPSLVGTEEFQRLNNTRQITRCLTKQGLILTLIKEDKHPRAREFQKFACAVLDSYMTHGEVGRHEATSVADLTAKINAENEAKQLVLEQTRANNDRLRIEFDGKIKLKQLEIKEKKVENAALIQEKDEEKRKADQALNLRAWICILNEHNMLNVKLTKFQTKRVNKLVGTLKRSGHIEWIYQKITKKRSPFFVSHEALADAKPIINGINLSNYTQRVQNMWANSPPVYKNCQL